jgi:hypothetical protein
VATPSIGAAFKPLLGALCGALSNLGTQQRTALLALAHDKVTTPIAAQCIDVLTQSIPEVRVLGVDLSGAVTDKLPAAQTQLAAALDEKVALLLDWATPLLAKAGEALSQPTQPKSS